jgi:hypothetical protein
MDRPEKNKDQRTNYMELMVVEMMEEFIKELT